MAATIEGCVVKHRIQDMDIPVVDLGTFLRQICDQYGDRIALVDTLIYTKALSSCRALEPAAVTQGLGRCAAEPICKDARFILATAAVFLMKGRSENARV